MYCAHCFSVKSRLGVCNVNVCDAVSQSTSQRSVTQHLYSQPGGKGIVAQEMNPLLIYKCMSMEICFSAAAAGVDFGQQGALAERLGSTWIKQ